MSNQNYLCNRLQFVFAILFLLSAKLFSQTDSSASVLVFEIKDEIAKPALRVTQKAFEEARAKQVNYIILHLNTYGGRVDIADSIRTRILNSEIPVMAFVDNQAISAGALISIACDSIYMRPGGSIGASTVVSQSGEPVPDKYQSFMRSTMRATAEAHGKDTIIQGNDTVYVWRRDPKIAESMVDPKLYVPGIVDTGMVLTLTAEEAVKVNYCEGLAKDIPEVLKKAGLEGSTLYYYKPSGLERFIGFLLSPAVQGILIMIIVGGIYFELQSPGVGFPLAIAIAAAIVYFAPLYVEGLAQNWELLAFIAGVILLAMEIFVIPGFGVAGIAGIILVFTGLTMSLIDNVVFEFEGVAAFGHIVKVFFRVLISVVLAFGLSLYISSKVGSSKWFSGVGLAAVQDKEQGFIGVDLHLKEMTGQTGVAYTVLRPSGRIMIGNELFDAKSEIGFIDKGEKVKVIRNESGQLYVIKEA
ncbi:MAG: nodulation protein NfeD [Bacteroidales bacterium]|nr:nodulation protein NfeD [Bacteroidales bacterium]